jgi:centractin
LTEPPLNPRSNRDTAAQILFETFNVPAIHTSIQAVLSLYASGRTTGIVLDSGDGVSHAVPVFEGFAMPNSIQRIDIAGRDVTEYLQQLLRKSGYVFNTSAEKEVVRLMKESLSWVTPDPKREEKMWAGGKHPEGKVGEYVLPDGRKIKVGQRAGVPIADEDTDTTSSSVQNDSAPQRFSSTPSSSARSTPACTRSLSTLSRARIWTSASPCIATLCFPAAAP